jgi:FtsZ-interacting cell division protein YlmF
MERFKKLFMKKNEPAAEFEDLSNGYYGNDRSTNNVVEDSSFSDSDISDVSVVLSGDPVKEAAEAPLKRTFTPTTCRDSADIVDAFKDGRVIVICVEELDKPNFTRLFDYLMGAVQALDGELQRIDRDTVVLLPDGFDSKLSIDDIEEEAVEEEDTEDGEDID